MANAGNVVDLGEFKKTRGARGKEYQETKARRERNAQVLYEEKRIVGRCPLCGRTMTEENSTYCVMCSERVCGECLIALDTVDGSVICKECAREHKPEDIVKTCPRCGSKMLLTFKSISNPDESICEYCSYIEDGEPERASDIKVEDLPW